MKIGKTESGVSIYCETTQLFLKMKVGQSILFKPEKGETITWLRKHLSGYMGNFRYGKYKYQKRRIFTQRLIYKNNKPIAVRMWRIK